MDPTPEEIKVLNTLGKILEWTGLPGPPGTIGTPQQTLLMLLGATTDMHPRIIAAITDEDYKAAILPWKTGDPASPPTPAMRAGPSGAVWACMPHHMRYREVSTTRTTRSS